MVLLHYTILFTIKSLIMPREIYRPGKVIGDWDGVRVFKKIDGQFIDITKQWSWSDDAHEHYEVKAIPNARGSYWVPVSTNPPKVWGDYTKVIGTNDTGGYPVNPGGKEFRPTGTYIWIPDASITVETGESTNSVVCNPPASYPANQLLSHISLLQEVLGDDKKDQSSFQDSDGLISFVNLTSSLVTKNKQFKTGRSVCDKVANFFATMRVKVFAYLKEHPEKVLADDTPPVKQWDPAVTHYMQYLLVQAGGFSSFEVITEEYSSTQVIAEFNTDVLKMIFDAVVVPENILTDMIKFIKGVGTTLRTSWDDRSRSFQTCLLGQCHEAVQADSTGKNFIYFPKVKYYRINVNSSQQEFTSPCTDVKQITFNFTYDYYVTALKASILDPTSTEYKDFIAFLDEAQGISYKDAKNNLDAILNGVTSKSPQPKGLEANAFGVNLMEYPRIEVSSRLNIQDVLNSAVTS
jgi:hypothetical protein